MRLLNSKILFVTWSLVLVNCGGGGDSTGGGGSAPPPPTSAPAAPTLSLGFGIKQLQFGWPAMSGTSFYRLFQNPDGVSGFTQVGGDLVSTAHSLDIAVHRHEWPHARYLVEACNSLGCTSSNEVDTAGAMLTAIGYFKASNTDTEDRFGQTFALSGDGQTLAVGSRFESSTASGIGGNQADDCIDPSPVNCALNSGAVYLFTRVNGAWIQQAYVKASNADALDNFGTSVTLSDDGNTLAVGASQEASAARGSYDTSAGQVGSEQTDDTALAAGAVYVFTRSGGSWTQRAYIKASNSEAADGFGGAVSLSGDGNTLAVGAEGEDSATTDESNNGEISPGAVYVFTRSGNLWTQQAYVKASSPGFKHNFGSALGLNTDGDTLAVGAWGESSSATGVGGNENHDCGPAPTNCAFQSGAAYVFARSGANWAQQAYMKASNTDAGDVFGLSIALSDDGDTLAVGAYREDSAAAGIYDSTTGQGSTEQADNSSDGTGAVYVFTRSGALWSQQAYIKASNAEAQDFFGGSVSLSTDGNSLAVGAFDEDSAATGIDGSTPGQSDNTWTNSGAAYVFTRNGNSWSQHGYVKAPDTAAFDFFGNPVVLSNDGNTLAVGAVGEDSAATGINDTAIGQGDSSSPSAGAVYLY